MAIKFITGRDEKFAEIRDMLAPVEIEQIKIKLDEIQSLDPREVIKHKLVGAEKQQAGEYIVEDTSLFFECFNYQLPGPFIKWFLDTQKPQGLFEIANKMGKYRARAVTIIGYADGFGDIRFFEGQNEGVIASPRGSKDFGWGPVFQPHGYELTFGEMDRELKYEISMRALAAKKLKEFLLSKHS